METPAQLPGPSGDVIGLCGEVGELLAQEGHERVSVPEHKLPVAILPPEEVGHAVPERGELPFEPCFVPLDTGYARQFRADPAADRLCVQWPPPPA